MDGIKYILYGDEYFLYFYLIFSKIKLYCMDLSEILWVLVIRLF